MSALSLHCAISVVLPTALLPGYAGANRLAVPGGVVKWGQKGWLPGGNHQGVAKNGGDKSCSSRHMGAAELHSTMGAVNQCYITGSAGVTSQWKMPRRRFQRPSMINQ